MRLAWPFHGSPSPRASSGPGGILGVSGVPGAYHGNGGSVRVLQRTFTPADTAARLSAVLNTTAELWMTLQVARDLWFALKAFKAATRGASGRRAALFGRVVPP